MNSVDSWNRHRIEGYSFVRLPGTPGFHQIEVNSWRPRASLDAEIHSFFLGGSVRIQKLEELVRTQFVDSKGYSDIVNRFGLETEDAGKIKVNINLCTQDLATKRREKLRMDLMKNNEKLQTRKLVMKFKMDLKKQSELVSKQGMLDEDELSTGKNSDAESRSENLNHSDRDQGNSNMVGGQNRFMP